LRVHRGQLVSRIPPWFDLTAVDGTHDRDRGVGAKALTELIEPALEISALAAPESMPIDLVATHFLSRDNKCLWHVLSPRQQISVSRAPSSKV
jgi:hypothetical protein